MPSTRGEGGTRMGWEERRRRSDHGGEGEVGGSGVFFEGRVDFVGVRSARRVAGDGGAGSRGEAAKKRERQGRDFAQGSVAVALVLALLSALSCGVSAAIPFSLSLEQTGNVCDGTTSWVKGDCQLVSGKTFPDITVVLLNAQGGGCCGDDQVESPDHVLLCHP